MTYEFTNEKVGAMKLQHFHNNTGETFNIAGIDAQLISVNPAAYIELSKNAPKNIVKRHIITPEQFSSLLEKYPFGSQFYIPLLLLYHTGMRLGEVLGLTWQDIDFATKKINLHQQLQYLSKRGYFFTTLKTESNNRYIIVDDILLGELKRWRNQRLHTEARIKIFAEKIFPQQNLSSSNAAGFFFAAVDVNLVTC